MCSAEENVDRLAVAHFTGGNVEIMKPLSVNETHVMIDIRDLSLFGLLKRMIFTPSPIAAQVLLFLRPITVRQRENILDVHLLPLNVPLSEVSVSCINTLWSILNSHGFSIEIHTLQNLFGTYRRYKRLHCYGLLLFIFDKVKGKSHYYLT